MISSSNPAWLPPFYHTRILPAIVLLCLSLPALAVEAERIPRDGPDEIRATVTIASSVEQILMALEQPCQLRQWMPQLDSLQVLDTPAPGQTLVYIATNIGWPFSPRDAITLFTRHEGPPVRLDMQSQAQALAPHEGYARIPFSEGSWTLTALGTGTQVEYSQRVVPGGHIPQWLADKASVTQSKELLLALDRHVSGSGDMSCSDSEHSPETLQP